MHDHVGEPRLLERRLERLDQLVRQLADEADRVRDEEPATVVLVRARRRVERLEQPLPHPDAGSGERVEQGRLARVRVAGERDRRRGRGLAAGALDAAVALDAREPPPQRGDPVAGEPAVRLDLRLAGAAGADAAVDAPRPEPFEVGPQAPHAGEVVLQLRELDLELALGRVCVVGEDVEDDRGAVDHRDVERRLEVALLARNELVVAGDQVGAVTLDLRAQLGELAAPEVAVRVGLGRTCTSSPAVATPAVRSSSLSSARGSPSPSASGATPIASARWRALGLRTPAPFSTGPV